jgi:hypothetical protein
MVGAGVMTHMVRCVAQVRRGASLIFSALKFASALRLGRIQVRRTVYCLLLTAWPAARAAVSQ